MNTKERKTYVSPKTKRTLVEIEGNLCGSIDAKTDNNGVNIAGQGVATPGTDETGKNYNDFSDSYWGEIK